MGHTKAPRRRLFGLEAPSSLLELEHPAHSAAAQGPNHVHFIISFLNKYQHDGARKKEHRAQQEKGQAEEQEESRQEVSQVSWGEGPWCATATPNSERMHPAEQISGFDELLTNYFLPTLTDSLFPLTPSRTSGRRRNRSQRTTRLSGSMSTSTRRSQEARRRGGAREALRQVG